MCVFVLCVLQDPPSEERNFMRPHLLAWLTVVAALSSAVDHLLIMPKVLLSHHCAHTWLKVSCLFFVCSCLKRPSSPPTFLPFEYFDNLRLTSFLDLKIVDYISQAPGGNVIKK